MPVSAEMILVAARDVRIPNYAEEVSRVIRDQLKSVFQTLIDTETEVKTYMAALDYADIDWVGKFDNWTDATFTLPTSAHSMEISAASATFV